MPLISVILPVYNRQKVVEECIASVLNQSWQDFEIIVVDDGSADRSLEVCQALAEKDTRIRVFCAKHNGVSAARNRALAEAQGEYVFFLDSDDVIYPLLLETLEKAMVQYGAAMGGSDIRSVSEANWSKVQDKIREAPVPGHTTHLTHEQALATIFHGNCPLSCIGGVMMRRDLIQDTLFRTDLHIGEDYLFIYENLIKGADCVFLEEKWYYVRNHANNSSWDWSYQGFWTRFLRRKLVWEQETAFGRMEYANIQKRDAVSCFLTCARRNHPSSKDSKKMRSVMKSHLKTLLSAYGFKGKLRLIGHIFFPAISQYIKKKSR